MQIAFDRLEPEPRKALVDALRTARRRVVRLANFLCRGWWRLDADALDAFQTESGRLPAKGKEWPTPRRKSDGYRDGRMLDDELSSGITAAVSKHVADKWRGERWEALIWQRRSPPHFRESMPIPVRAQDYRLVQRAGEWWLSLALTSGHGQRVEIPIGVRDAFQRRAIVSIAAGLWKGGELKIEQDSKRPSRWYVRLAYKRRVDRVADDGTFVVIHRGIRSFLVAVTSNGDEWRYDGNDIEAYLKQIQARRRKYQRDAKASGRNGRGRRRILRPIAPLMEKGERWRRTKSQTIARRFTEWCRDRGVTHYVIEDLSGIRRGEPERLDGGERVWRRVQEWPYHDLGTRIESCFAELGIEGVVQEAAFVSQRCPGCGCVARANRDLSRWRLRCSAGCGYSRDLEIGACENALARATAARAGEPWDLRQMYERRAGDEETARKPAPKKKKSKASAKTTRKPKKKG